MEQNKKDPRVYPTPEDQLTHTGHYTDIRVDWNIRGSKHRILNYNSEFLICPDRVIPPGNTIEQDTSTP